MKPRIVSTLFAVLAACLSSRGLAAPVVFEKPVTISGDKDVLNTGSLDRAINLGGPGQTVNGVPFAAATDGHGSTSAENSGITIASSPESVVAVQDAVFAGEGEPYTSLSAPYKSLLGSGAYNNTTKGTLTVTVAGLKAGTSYVVQFFVNDSRGVGRTATVASGGVTSEPVSHNTTVTAGGVGQYLIAKFTADGATQEFVVAPVNPEADDAQLNAVQIRVNAAAK